MSYEQIKAYLFEKNPSSMNIYIELSSFKSLSFLLTDSLLSLSKNNFSIINFDPLYYRHCVTKKKPLPNTIFDHNQLQSIKFDNNVLIVGLNLLPKNKMNCFLRELTTHKISNIVFISNSPFKNNDNNLIIRNICSLLIIENSFRKKENVIYSKMDVINLVKCSKENIIFEYENNNNIKKKFKQISLYSGEVKLLFEEIKKIAEHETTFNVKISEEELKQKNEVNLPYIKTSEEKRSDLIEVDDADLDELYEEDPDEDLDI